MNRAAATEEDSTVATSGAARPSGLRHSIVWLGIPLTTALALIDAQALQAVQGSSRGWLVYGVYTLFVLQTGAVSAIAGIRLQRELTWWGIFAWAILLVDLQVFSLAGPSNHDDVVKKLGFAIASAQIGMLTCFGVMGATVWRIRWPIVGIGLALAVFFARSLEGADTWYLLLFFQCLATLTTCLVLRRFGFRIERLDLLPRDAAASNKLQFSIKHLFYWTTGVACLVAVGRFIGWRALVNAGMELGRVPELLVHVPLLTLVSIVGMWGALGREAWWTRVGTLSLLLPAAGFVFGLSARLGQSGWDNLFYLWRGGTSDLIELGIVWTVLAGALLAGSLLVFRASKNRLQRRAAG